MATATLKVKKLCPRGCVELPQDTPIQNCPTCGHKLTYTVINETPRNAVACEMAKRCPDAGANCYVASSIPADPQGARDVFDWLCTPAKRWMYCYGYKKMLSLEFLPEVGVYGLRKCPCCGVDLVKYLSKQLNAKA